MFKGSDKTAEFIANISSLHVSRNKLKTFMTKVKIQVVFIEDEKVILLFSLSSTDL